MSSKYRDENFEWDARKSADRMARSGFDFHAATRIFGSERFVERWDEAHSPLEEHWIATGLLGSVFISVVYVWRDERRRIISSFEADSDDIADFMVTYGIKE